MEKYMDCFKASLYRNVPFILAESEVTALISEVIICGILKNWIALLYGVIFCPSKCNLLFVGTSVLM